MVSVAAIVSIATQPPAIETALARFGPAVAEAGSYRYKMTSSFEVDPAKESGEAWTVQGIVDVASDRSRAALVSDIGGVDFRCTFIATERFLYTGVHPAKRAVVGGAWVRGPLTGYAATPLSGYQILPEDLYRNPQRLFEELEKEGGATIDGVETTEYVGELSFRRDVDDRASTAQPNELTYEFPVRLYVDDEGLLRRMEFSVRISGGRNVFGGSTTMDLYDYGEPVDVALPPPAQVVTDRAVGRVTNPCVAEG